MRRALGAAVSAVFVVLAAASPAPAEESTFRQPAHLDWDHKALDVLIVPPAHGQIANGDGTLGGGDPNELVPIANSYVRATEKAIEDWRRAIRAFGSRSLKQVTLNVYVLGRDVFPQSVLSELEILITYDETKGPMLGLTVSGGEPTWVEYNGVRVAVGNNPRCIIANSMLAPMNLTFADMYNVAGHEFGHCLGVEHSEPAGHPALVDDLMHWRYESTVGARGNALQCISNLNIAGVELAFDNKPAPGVATLAASRYRRISC